MKRFSALFLSLIILFGFPVYSHSADGFVVSAKSALVLCADNGEIVFEKNAYEKLPMASTTKIMTALITLEQSCPDKKVRVKKESVDVEGTSMGLKAGDSVDYRTLVCGMLLSSGNDAANAAATDISGSLEGFAVLMNERARAIGMNNTCFVTPSGLDDENHYSTAYDMALLTKEAIKNKSFCDICSSKRMTVTFGNPESEHTLFNHNRLLNSVDGVFGVKTGFTKKSGRCLVSACKRDGVTLICVTLNDPDDWSDHKKLYDYCFKGAVRLDDDFTEVGVRVTGGEMRTVDVECESIPVSFNTESDITRTILVESFLYAPVEAGQKVGTVLYFSADGKIIRSVDLISVQSVNRVKTEKKEKKKSVFSFIKSLFGS